MKYPFTMRCHYCDRIFTIACGDDNLNAYRIGWKAWSNRAWAEYRYLCPRHAELHMKKWAKRLEKKRESSNWED